jgi:hypothetical protein
MADRDAIRAELESTRAAYHTLLNSIPEADWQRKSGNRAWTVKQLMSHLASAPAYTAGSIGMVRRGKGFNPPGFLVNTFNVLTPRWGARGATPESAGEQYDAGHEKLIALLDTVEDGEWQKGSRFFGQHQTIEQLFRSVPEHFKEHEPDIRKGIG